MSDVYAEATRMTREAIVNEAVKEASALLADGEMDAATEVLYAPRVLRAAEALEAAKG